MNASFIEGQMSLLSGKAYGTFNDLTTCSQQEHLRLAAPPP